MEDHPSRLQAFLTELKRRKEYRVAAAYAAGPSSFGRRRRLPFRPSDSPNRPTV